MLKRWLSGVLALVLTLGLIVTMPPKASAATVLTSSDALISVLKKMEGFSSKPYWDYAQYTVGYGTKCPDDKLEEYRKNGIPQDEAEKLLKTELKKAETAINNLAATYDLTFKQNEFDALVSFTYNCGTGWTKEYTGFFNTAVRNGDKSNAFLYGLCLWSTAGGEYILIDRRMCEANIYINGEYRAPNAGGELYPENFRWVFLDGNGGSVRYKIYAYDGENPQSIDAAFSATPKGTDKDGESFSYTFAGWYTEGGAKITKLNNSLSRGETLYAKWKDPNGKIVDVTKEEPPAETPDEKIKVKVTGDVVNVRSGPGTDYGVVDTVTEGMTLTVTEIKETSTYTWGKISSGWLCLDYTDYSGSLAITRQPASVTVPKGEKAAVSLAATGTDLSYQWYIRNAGSKKFSKSSIKKSTYSVTMDSAKNGREIYCVVTDKKGNSVTSETVTLYMGKPLQITTQPKNKTAVIDASVSVSVKASGDGLKYKWYYCNYGSNTFQVSSLTSSTYRTTMSKERHGRKLYCVITDKYGNKVTTNTVTIKSATALITKQPASVTAAVGKTASVTVEAAGKDLSYQWYIRNAGSKKFSKSSIKSAKYSVTMAEERDGRELYCVITDAAGKTAKTKTVTVKMDKDLYIIQQPASVIAAEGQTVTVKMWVNGAGLSYQWYVRNPGAKNFSKSSITESTYTIQMNEKRSGREVYCKITDATGKTVKTNTVGIYIDNSPFIITQPKNATAVNGQKATVQVVANGKDLKYQWYFKNAGGTKFSKASIKSAKYSVTMNEERDGRQLYCVITDAAGNVLQTKTVKLTMLDAITITQKPKSESVPNGKKVTVSVKAEGNDLTYRWYYKNAGSTKFSASSVTTASYTVTMDGSHHNRQLYCLITDCYGNTEKTNTVTIKSTTAVITTQPKNATAVNGQKATVQVVADGKDLKYQWYFKNAGGTKFSKASIKSATYSVTMTEERDGRQLYCIVTDAAGNSVQSKTVTISMK